VIFVPTLIPKESIQFQDLIPLFQPGNSARRLPGNKWKKGALLKLLGLVRGVPHMLVAFTFLDV